MLSAPNPAEHHANPDSHPMIYHSYLSYVDIGPIEHGLSVIQFPQQVLERYLFSLSLCVSVGALCP